MSENTSRQDLIAEAKELGIEFPKNITDEKLEELIGNYNSTPTLDMINALQAQIDRLSGTNKVEDNNTVDLLVRAMSKKDASSKIDRGINVADTPNRDEKIVKALTHIRCTIMSRDPSKQTFKAEIISFSNDLIGDIKYRVDFNTETHIPYCIYRVLKDKKVNIFDPDMVSGSPLTGQVSGGYNTIEAYNINVLPPLTKKQLEELAKKQKLRSDDLDEREDAILDSETTKIEEKDELKELGYSL